VIMRKLVMGIADARMEVDGREIYAASDLRVGLFTSTDNFYRKCLNSTILM